MPKLTKLLVEETAPQSKDVFVWDSDLKGFGLRVKPSGAKSFIVQYRQGVGRKWPTKRITLGRFGVLTVEEARRAAKKELARIALGADPRADRDAAARALTVAELCDEYLRATELGSVVTRSGKPKAASTLIVDRGRIARHIKPVLGSKRASDLIRADVRRLFEAVASGETSADEPTGKLRGRAIVTGGTGTAKKAVTLLRAVLSFGMQEGHVRENPVVGFRLPKDGRRSVDAPEDLFRDLGAALDAAERRGEPWQAVSIVRLLAFTGMRREEAVGLRWEEVDFDHDCLRLPDTKTGVSVRPLGENAFELLLKIREMPGAPEPLLGPVFPAARRGEGSYGGLPGAWRRIVAAEELDADMRARLAPYTPHHLRHALVTVANRNGMSDATAGAIVGHKVRTVTAGYITHVLDDVLLEAADRLSNIVADLLREGAERDPALDRFPEDVAVELAYPDDLTATRAAS